MQVQDPFVPSADLPQGSFVAWLDSFASSDGAPHGSLVTGADSLDASDEAPQGSELDGGAAVAAFSQRSGSVLPSFAWIHKFPLFKLGEFE